MTRANEDQPGRTSVVAKHFAPALQRFRQLTAEKAQSRATIEREAAAALDARHRAIDDAVAVEVRSLRKRAQALSRCDHCGAEKPPQEEFCPTCGARLRPPLFAADTEGDIPTKASTVTPGHRGASGCRSFMIVLLLIAAIAVYVTTRGV